MIIKLNFKFKSCDVYGSIYSLRILKENFEINILN
jgi:hypothetical protein